MRNKVRTYIEQHELLEAYTSIVVAVSGGADSVALLHLLHSLGYDCYALHCNFHLRGEESNRDAQFVRKLCTELNIPLRIKDFDTERIAREGGLSIEMAARDLRYAWFEEMREELSCDAIAVAHHRDDQAETILMNLTRGTGLKGMRGILPRNGYVVRPLLCVSRNEIIDYLQQEGLDYVVDSTNSDTHIRRNHFRHNVLPALEVINPRIKETLAQEQEQFCDYYRLAEERIDELAHAAQVDDYTIDLDPIKHHPARETILYHLLKAYDFQPAIVRQISQSLNGISGKRFFSPTHQAELHDGQLLLCELGKESDMPLPQLLRTDRPYNGEPLAFPQPKEWKALFDGEKLQGSLTIRHWQQGDTFAPFGMKGKRQKVSDYFTDHHFTLRQKQETWLLLCEEEIVWVVGHRTSEHFRIDAQTRQITEINVITNE